MLLPSAGFVQVSSASPAPLQPPSLVQAWRIPHLTCGHAPLRATRATTHVLEPHNGQGP